MSNKEEARSVEDTIARSAMKQALEALTFSQSDSIEVEELIDDAIIALEEALAKQEQGEPFGWYDMEHGEIRDVEWNRQKPTYEGVWRPLYTTPQPAQKPWVGLTDEEVADLGRHELWIKQFIRTIEAKLKEKNT